jgi:hypothetical protein
VVVFSELVFSPWRLHSRKLQPKRLQRWPLLCSQQQEEAAAAAAAAVQQGQQVLLARHLDFRLPLQRRLQSNHRTVLAVLVEAVAAGLVSGGSCCPQTFL